MVVVSESGLTTLFEHGAKGRRSSDRGINGGNPRATRGAEAVYAAKALEPAAAPCEGLVVNLNAGDGDGSAT
jgi:hypothetical protein